MNSMKNDDPKREGNGGKDLAPPPLGQPYPETLAFEEWVERGKSLKSEGELLREKVIDWNFNIGDWLNLANGSGRSQR